MAKKENTWKDSFEYIPYYRQRIEQMQSYLYFDKISSIMDLGCGLQTLKEFIPDTCRYYPVDYLAKLSSTIIKDFNNNEFLYQKVDVCFCSGIFEYIYNLELVVQNISLITNVIVGSYAFTDWYPERKSSWVNHYSLEDFFNIFKNYDFEVILHPEKVISNFILCKKGTNEFYNFINYKKIQQNNMLRNIETSILKY